LKNLLRERILNPAACLGGTLRMGFRFGRSLLHPARKDDWKAAGIIQPIHRLVNFGKYRGEDGTDPLISQVLGSPKERRRVAGLQKRLGHGEDFYVFSAFFASP
jgi:hypothetical protein